MARPLKKTASPSFISMSLPGEIIFASNASTLILLAQPPAVAITINIARITAAIYVAGKVFGVSRFKGSRVQGSRVQGSRVQGFKVQGSRVQGFKVQGSRFIGRQP